MKQELNDNKSLADFNFDEDVVFFETTPETDEVSTVIKEVKGENDDIVVDDDTPKPEEKKEVKQKEDVVTEEEEPIFFEEKKSDDAEVKPSVEDTDKNKGDKFYETLTNELKEKGVFKNITLEKDEVVDEDKFFELHQKEIEIAAEENVKELFEGLDDDAKSFIKFKKDGGKTADFLSIYSNSIELDELDIENENQRDYVLEYYLSTVEGKDPEEVKDAIEFYKSSGRDKINAEKYFLKLKEIEDRQKQELLDKTSKLKKERQDKIKEFNKSIEDTLTKIDKVGDFTFTDKDKKDVASFLIKPTVKLPNNKYVPAFQAKLTEILKAETPENVDKLLLLAKLINNNFDISDATTKVKTATIKNAREKLESAKQGVRVSNTGGVNKKSLADYVF